MPKTEVENSGDESAPGDPPVAQPKKASKTVGLGKVIGLVLLTAVVGGFVTLQYDNYRDRIRSLSYIVQERPNQLTPPNAKVDISVAGKAVDAISSATLFVFNTEGKHYEDLTVFVEINDDKPINIISLDTFPKKEYYSLEMIVDEVNRKLFKYTFPNANRASKSFFNAEYLFEGGSVPDFNLRVEEEAAAIERWDESRLRNEESAFTLGRIAFWIIYGIVVSLITSVVIAIAQEVRKTMNTNKSAYDDNFPGRLSMSTNPQSPLTFSFDEVKGLEGHSDYLHDVKKRAIAKKKSVQLIMENDKQYGKYPDLSRDDKE